MSKVLTQLHYWTLFAGPILHYCCTEPETTWALRLLFGCTFPTPTELTHNLFSSCSVHTATISSHHNLFCSCSVHTDTELTPHCFVVAVYTVTQKYWAQPVVLSTKQLGSHPLALLHWTQYRWASSLLFSCTEPKTNDTASVVYVQYLHWTNNWT